MPEPMFIEPNEMTSVIHTYTLGQLSADDTATRSAILMAIGEMTSYLNGRYDCKAIFNATGDDRDPLVVEHCKSIALWYLIRASNAQILFDKARVYYDNAIDWLKSVAGVGESGKSIAPDLPLKKEEDGSVKSPLRMGSNPKFKHHF